MSAIVFGATGIVGGYILGELTQAGLQPMALSRMARSDVAVEWVQGDLNAPDLLPPIDAKTIFCTVSLKLFADALPDLKLLAAECIVAFSSTSVVTKIDSEIESERDYLRHLAEAERAMIAFCESRNIRWIILRPTLIYAEGRDGNVTRLARFIKRFKFFPLMGQGEGLRQPVHAQDLAKGAIDAAAAGTNKIYVVPGRDILSYRDMVGRIFDALHLPKRIIAVHPFFWTVAFALARPWLPNTNVAMGKRMASDMVFDATSAEADFGWAPRGFHPDFRNFP